MEIHLKCTDESTGMCEDTGDSQPGTALGVGEGPWLDTGPECSLVGLARSTLLPSPTAQPAPLMLPQKLASARRQMPTTPEQASLPSHCMPPPHPHPWSGFIQDSGEGETPTTPAGRPYPGNVATWCGETVSEMAHLGNPRMLASLSPPVVGLKWLKPTPLSRKQESNLEPVHLPIP